MSASAVIETIVTVLILSGTALSLLSSFGIIRLPDVYTRAHAATKSATLGILCILLGAFIHFIFTHGVVSIRLLLGIVFVFLTAPVAGHLVIRSAHRSGVQLSDTSVRDDLQRDLDAQKQEQQEQGQELVQEMGQKREQALGDDSTRAGGDAGAAGEA